MGGNYMKKNLIVALALVFVLGIAGTAFAAANPFVDVPAKHWAYDAVTKLAQAGILDGYGDGTYRGERLATRYEMAQATAKAMARADKADAQMKGLIDKLAVEFAAELNNLGVRVAKLEKNASSIKFTGDARIRYQRTSNAAASPNWDERVRLNLAAELNEKAAFEGRMLIQNRHTNVQGQNDQFEMDKAQFVFKNVFEGSNLTIGRIGDQTLLNSYFFNWGYWDGAKVDFKVGKVDLMAGYGDARFNQGGPQRVDATNTMTNPLGFWAFGAKYQASKEFALSAAYLSSDSDPNQLIQFSTWGLGLKYAVTDWMFMAEYAKNTKDFSTLVDPRTDAMLFQLNYKLADKAKPGSWQLYVQWSKIGNQMQEIGALNGAYFQAPINTSGWAYGLKYAIAKNVIAGVEVQSLKTYDGADRANDANNGFQFRTDFWF